MLLGAVHVHLTTSLEAREVQGHTTRRALRSVAHRGHARADGEALRQVGVSGGVLSGASAATPAVPAPGRGVLGLVDLVLQPVVAPRLLVVIVRLERCHEVLDPHVGGLAESVRLAGPRRELSEVLGVGAPSAHRRPC